jgi:hypothetical protein
MGLTAMNKLDGVPRQILFVIALLMMALSSQISAEESQSQQQVALRH